VAELPRDPAHGWAFYAHERSGHRTDTGAFKVAHRHLGNVACDSLSISLWSQLETNLIYIPMPASYGSNLRPYAAVSGMLLYRRFQVSSNKSIINHVSPRQLAAQIRAVALAAV
jgi:hypothetical protein